MELSVLDKIGPIADRLTSFALALAFIVIVGVSGAKGVWVFGNQAKARMDEKDKIIKEKDHEIEKRDAKLHAQERLIDRLSGLADRTMDLARPAVVHDIQEHRSRQRAANDG